MSQTQQPYLIFDFGNVLLDIDYTKTIDAFNQLLGTDWNAETIPENVKDWMKSYEQGMFSSEAFMWKFQSHFDSSLNPIDIIKAWNSLLIGIPVGRIQFLQDLRKKYNVALLSNTNQIHIEWVYQHLEKDHQITGSKFEKSCFNTVFYSHLLKMRKPDKSIYDTVALELNIDPGNILFVDDLYKNIVGARESGWVAVNHRPESKIEEELTNYLYYWNLIQDEMIDN